MKKLILLLMFVGCGGDDATPTPDAPDPARCVVAPGAAAETVATTSGRLRGARDGETFAYKRVPFAAPPIGANRYAPPQPVTCPAGEVDATTFGPVCPQLEGGAYVGDEDCLQLNVWAPVTASATPRPVMVWIHGGGNTGGSAIYPYYDGRRLAEAGDVIVVTANYRLGQLGYLAHPTFGEGTGTYGILDQIAALKWLRDNIAAFGGDPGNVTIFGESAGGRNVCTLVASPPAKGLFHRAIVESGSCKGVPTRTKSEQVANDVVAAAGCSGDIAACMRGLPAETIIRSLPSEASTLTSSPYQPMLDGIVLTDQPAKVMAAGGHAQVPFMVGANADETANSAPMITSDAQYQALVRMQLPQPLADMALAQYPSSAFPTPRAAYVRLTTDSRFVCPSREIAKAADAGQTAPVYRYFFQYKQPASVHGLEVPFVFGTLAAIVTPSGPYQPTAADLALSATIQGYWTRFARTGDPGGTPAWPTYSANDTTLVFDSAASPIDGIRTTQCDFWAPYLNL